MKYKLAFIILAIVAVWGCRKKDSAPPNIPTLTTTAVININGSTAQGGGAITDNGGATITVSGICWSKVNNIPTIADDTTKSSTFNGSFTSAIKNLQPSATYYVRSYAINSAGTGYGNVVTFNTGNAGPQAKNISFVGTAAVTNKIKVTYTYFDFENDPKSGSTFQWYIASDTVSASISTILGASDSTYTIIGTDQNKFLRVVITPKASTGTSPGTATNSYWIGPVIPEPTSVTFIYNSQTVTYGIIISSVTQKRWLDRNLGATRAATSATDYLAYGDLFQWGRPADGHQLVSWTNSTTGAAVNSGTTTTKASSDIPGDNLFIIASAAPQDWRADYNNNRWNTNFQGPCPNGWHIPTKDEWIAEGANVTGNVVGQNLNLPFAGYRSFSSGNLFLAGSRSYYWSSTGLWFGSYTGIEGVGNNASGSNETIILNSSDEARGRSLRCIKD